jgi:hypothetical protein
VVSAAAIYIVVRLLADMLRPGDLSFFAGMSNPIGVAWLGSPLITTGFEIGLSILLLLAMAAMITRYRQANPGERKQLKWLLISALIGGMMTVIGVAGTYLGFANETFYNLIFFGFVISIPITLGIAILRYRLWDIDFIIRRTLTYGFLTTVLGLLYLGSVALLQNAFTSFSQQQSPLAIVLSTLAIAVLFNPLRKWIQRTIDARFYRRSYNSEQTLQAFASTLRNEVQLDRLSNELLAVVQTTMQPEFVTLWISATSEGNPYVTLRNKRDTGSS